MNMNSNEPTIEEDRRDIDEEGPNYFLVGGPSPAYSKKRSSKLEPALQHLLMS